jgi:hypothetical protein
MLLGVTAVPAIGAELEVGAIAPHLDLAPLLFGESPGYVLEVPQERVQEALELLPALGVAAWDLGVTTAAPRLRVVQNGTVLVDSDLARLAQVHRSALARILL